MVVLRADRIRTFGDGVHFEIGERRGFPALAGEDVGSDRMIDGEELYLVQIGDLAQFFSDSNMETAILRDEGAVWNLNVLVVIDGEILAIAGACAERGHTENVGDKAELFAIPGPDHRTGA